MAERDREYLRQLRKNRDYEAELMKDVPGWEVGTWFGQKVYKTTPDNELDRVSKLEFYAGARPYYAKVEQYYKHWIIG